MHNHEQPQPDAAQGAPEADVPRTETASAPPSIWIGSLLDYNNGILHGEWVDATRDEEELLTEIHRVLSTSPTARQTGELAEEWAIFDSDNFGLAKIGEYESISTVAKLAQGIAEHGPAYAAYYSLLDGADEIGDFDDAYLGHWTSVEEYAENLVDDLGYEHALDHAVPGTWRSYVCFNTEQLASDMEADGSVRSADDPAGGVWLFDGR